MPTSFKVWLKVKLTEYTVTLGINKQCVLQNIFKVLTLKPFDFGLILKGISEERKKELQ